MAMMRPRLQAPLLVGVGAAFDFHAGLVPQAPAWMQRSGLEWAYRLWQEPRRLWRRYARYNPLFVGGFARQYLAHALVTAARRAPLISRFWMAASNSSAEVAVVGLGRVGLPLALSFADRGLRTIGVDRDPARARVACARAGCRSPSPARRRCSSASAAAGSLTLTDRVADAAAARPGRAHARHPLVLAHRDRHARHPLGARRPARGARPGHSLILRSTIAPGTTDFVAGYLAKHRGFQVGEDVFVAHAPERIAAGRFLEEIDTLPCIIGGVGERSGEVAAELFGVFDAPIVQTTPVQAELAKIWTNILRYTQFALPNLLMMDCERHAANVFEVIDLINRDYPRGGIAQPGLTAGTCLRKDFAFSEERSAAPGMLLAVSRVNESVPLFLLEGAKRRLGTLADRRVGDARARLQGRHRRRAGLARPQADPPRRARARGRRRPRPAGGDPDGLARGGRQGRRRGGDGHQPLATSAAPRRSRRSPRCASPECLVVDPWNCWGAGQVFAYASELVALGVGG